MLHIPIQDGRRFNRNLVKVFSAINPTAGTGIAEAVKSSFAATAAQWMIRNAGATGLIRPKYIRTVCTVAPASGTAAGMRIALDKGATRWSSGGSALTGKNRDMTSGVASNATVRFGALVTAAATADVRYIAQSNPSSVIAVAGDEIITTFGDPSVMHAAAASSLGGTTARRVVNDVGPVVLGASQEMIVHTWYPSNAATPASWEVEVCWEESLK